MHVLFHRDRMYMVASSHLHVLFALVWLHPSSLKGGHLHRRISTTPHKRLLTSDVISEQGRRSGNDSGTLSICLI